MIQDNSLSQLHNENYQTKKQLAGIYFEDKLEILLEPDWQNKKHKYRCITLAKNDCTTWQISSWEKLFIKINKYLNRILKMILDIYIIYIKYLN